MVINFNSVSEGHITAFTLTLSAVSDVDMTADRAFTLRALHGDQTFMSPRFIFTIPESSDKPGRTMRLDPWMSTNSGIASKLTFKNNNDSTTGRYIEVYDDQFLFGRAPITVSSIGNSLSYLCQLPSKSGTIALLNDVELWHLYLFLQRIQINNKDGFLGIDLYFNKNGYNFLTSALSLQEGFGTVSLPRVNSFLKQLCRCANNFSPDTASNVLIPAFGECTLLSGQTRNIIGMNAEGEVLFIQDNSTSTLTIGSTTVLCIYRLTKILD